VFRHRRLDELTERRLDVGAREINTKADSSGLREQRLDDRQDRQLATTPLRNR
jgi:hypothetical protein